MNTPVSFPLAKLLKEKRFDEPTPSFYFKNGEIGYGQLYNWNGSHNSTDISRPTIADVVMWLYEKHQIWVHAMMSFKEFTPYIQCDWNYKQDAIKEVLKFMEKRFNSPTEAYEAAIKHTLDNLI